MVYETTTVKRNTAFANEYINLCFDIQLRRTEAI